MKKILLLAAAVLFTAAAALFIQEVLRLRSAEEARISDNREVLARLTAVLPQTGDAQVSGEDDGGAPAVMEIDGYSCVGVLTLGGGRGSWAVAASDTEFEKSALPVLVSGSPAAGSLIIRGRNSGSGFKSLESLSAGDPAAFTDIDGRTWHYTAVGTAVLEKAQVEATLAGGNTGLVLTSEALRETEEIDLQLCCELAGGRRFIADFIGER